MHIRRKFISILICLAMAVAVMFGDSYPKFSIIETETKYDDADSITIWYTDAYLEEYIRNAAVVYEEQTGVRVIPSCVSGLEYLEAIQKATIDEDYGPDLYVIGSESLEKAYLSGLCTKVKDEDKVLNTSHFPQTSLNAVTYSNYLMGYPLMFEGSVFLYNRTLLEQIAEKHNEKLAMEAAETEDSSETEEITEEGEETQDTESELTTVTADDILPTSIVGIIEFALNYDPAEGMDSYFKWCISDVLYEYWFAGAYMNVGGDDGDNKDDIDIYNENSIYCMEVFQDFKQFFSMEIDDCSYDDVLKEFEEGKVLFMVADTDVIGKLEEDKKKEEGGFPYEYGISSIGMLNDKLQSKGLSVTKMVAVNGLSGKQELSEDFARFLTVDYSENYYSRTGKFPCSYQKTYQYPQMEDVVRTYENSVSLPKIVETSNYWVLAEMVFTKVWDGGNANLLLRSLSEQVKKQVHGVYVEEVYIEPPEITEDYMSRDI